MGFRKAVDGLTHGLRNLARPKPSKPGHYGAPPQAARSIILTGSVFVAIALIWSSLAEVEEVTRGSGKVIPSQRTQVVQSSEPGVVTEIGIALGQRVKKGDVLINLDETPNASRLGEVEAQIRALRAQVARLDAEARLPDVGSVIFNCPADVAAAVCDNEKRLIEIRQRNLDARLGGFKERVEQRDREIGESNAAILRLGEAVRLAEREHKLIAPMAARNLVAQTELIRVLRQLSENQGQLATAKETLGKLDAALREARLQLEEQKLTFAKDALGELTQKRAELSVAEETLKGAAERVRRTTIRSPIDGIINALNITTLGAFVNPGDKLLEIVPLEDNLLIEARVRPSDIAFIHRDQRAVIKVSAYDFYQYGGINGTVEQVSADSFFDPNTKETFFTVFIRTGETSLKAGDRSFAIMPGMVCDADIITGQKTILQYILKPIRRARWEAMRER